MPTDATVFTRAVSDVLASPQSSDYDRVRTLLSEPVAIVGLTGSTVSMLVAGESGLEHWQVQPLSFLAVGHDRLQHLEQWDGGKVMGSPDKRPHAVLCPALVSHSPRLQPAWPCTQAVHAVRPPTSHVLTCPPWHVLADLGKSAVVRVTLSPLSDTPQQPESTQTTVSLTRTVTFKNTGVENSLKAGSRMEAFRAAFCAEVCFKAGMDKDDDGVRECDSAYGSCSVTATSAIPNEDAPGSVTVTYSLVFENAQFSDAARAAAVQTLTASEQTDLFSLAFANDWKLQLR